MKKIFAITCMLLSAISMADTFAERGFQEELTQQISAMDSALESTEESQEEWALKSVFLRIQAFAGMEVPLLSKFEVVPEVELIWQR